MNLTVPGDCAPVPSDVLVLTIDIAEFADIGWNMELTRLLDEAAAHLYTAGSTVTFAAAAAAADRAGDPSGADNALDAEAP